jgi:hypothetical protein
MLGSIVFEHDNTKGFTLSRSTITGNDAQELKDFIDAAVSTLDEIDVLKGGLADTKKAIAEKLDLPVKALNVAIGVARKANLDDVKDNIDLVEMIIAAAGR